MKIALFTDVYKICGVSKMIYHLVKYCEKNQIDIVVFMVSPKEKIKTVGELNSGKNVKIIRLKTRFSFEIYPDLFLDLSYRNAKKIEEEFEKNDFDVIISPTPGVMGVRAVQFSKKYEIPLIFIHTTRIPEYAAIYAEKTFGLKLFEDSLRELMWSFMKFFYENSTLVLATTSEMKQELKERVETPVEIYSRGVDSKKFSPKFRKEHGKIRLIHVGRISAEKNLDMMVEVLEKEILPEYDNVEVKIIGDGPYLEKLVDDFPVADYTGFLTSRKLSEAFASGDIFLFPSLSETFGQVVLEAMASGLPVIAMESDVLKDKIKEGETGFLCGSRKDFAEKIKFLIEKPEKRKEMGKKAVEEAKKYSWDGVNSKLMEIVKGVAGRS